uniref:Glutathione transferase n=1 Tax=Arion vulgaris TaxID=1028688 RepID=A0A0B7BXB2_9EUPU
MAPKNIKLIYFDTRGRGEVLRLLLAAAGQAYEDVRVSKDDWHAGKFSTPFGQLPCLEIDGERYGQTVAIGNYIARQFGFHGKNDTEALKIDQIVQLSQDFINVIINAVFNSDESKKLEHLKALKEVEVPKYFSFYETLLSENGYFVGSSLTFADLTVYDVIDTIRLRSNDAVDAFPAIQNLIRNVESNDNVKAYLAARKPIQI